MSVSYVARRAGVTPSLLISSTGELTANFVTNASIGTSHNSDWRIRHIILSDVVSDELLTAAPTQDSAGKVTRSGILH
jgi:hypothetical protein